MLSWLLTSVFPGGRLAAEACQTADPPNNPKFSGRAVFIIIIIWQRTQPPEIFFAAQPLGVVQV
jgi:hypothetical protein